MDKGLIAINKLKQEIGKLQTEDIQNNNKISDSIKAYGMLMEDIAKLEESNNNLNFEKKKIIDAPENRKKYKKNMLMSLIPSVAAFIATILLILTMGFDVISVFRVSALATFCLTIVLSVVLAVEFKKIDQMFPLGDITKFEKGILLNDKKLENLYSKKKELDSITTLLQEKRIDLKSSIENFEKEISFIANIRAGIIEEFYKENPELDKKLDEAYDNFRAKEKIK